jgi:hypothetical protein
MNRNIQRLENGLRDKRGFTLLIAVVTTSMLLLVSFVVVNVALKQILLADAGEESQHAFYASDRGLECALYWDLTNGPVSQFATGTPGTIRCSDEEITSDSQVIFTEGNSIQSLIGGGALENPQTTTSIFQLQGMNSECAIVRVIKNVDGSTTIDSRGYNTCDPNALRRFERGVTITY